MIEQLSFFGSLPQIGQHVEYICCGKKYKGIVKGYSYGNTYVDCTTNDKVFSGVSLPMSRKGEDWITK